jgi:hypothetical protein
MFKAVHNRSSEVICFGIGFSCDRSTILCPNAGEVKDASWVGYVSLLGPIGGGANLGQDTLYMRQCAHKPYSLQLSGSFAQNDKRARVEVGFDSQHIVWYAVLVAGQDASTLLY